LAVGHLTLVPALREALDRLGRKEMPIVIGRVIPPQDYDELYKDRVSAVFGPGTVIPESALKVLQILEAKDANV
jgi:methylmalonyl-CoA mutase